jgi:DNA replication factor GINS
MQLDELQSVRDRERQTDKLQQLRASFYADAGEFIQQLRTERDRAAERADDPFDAPEVNRLTDEINTAEQTVEAIYEKRVGKIVKAASFAAADLPAEADGMTAEEQDLFDQLVGDIKDNREHVLDVLAGEGPQTSEQSQSVSSTARQTESPTPTANPAKTQPQDAGTAGEPTETPTQPPATESAGQNAAEATPGGGQPDASAGQSEPEPAAGNPPATGQSRTTEPSDQGVSAADVMGAGPDTEEQTIHQVPPETGQQTPPDQPVRKDGGTTTAPEPDDNASPNSEGITPDGAVGTEGVPRETVRITDDIDTFVGCDDRDYDLERNDVVTLPATNSDVLVERGSAKRLE